MRIWFMKKLYYFLLFVVMVILTGCASTAEQVMPPLTYSSSIPVHVTKNAYLDWEIGKQASGEAPNATPPPNGGIVGALLTNAIDSQMRKQNPSRYTFTYGKAQQAVFMASLRDVLKQNNVFKEVELITDSQSVRPQDVLIIIYFKNTRVLTEQNYKIILDVDVTIKTQGMPAFKRTYLVESNPGSFFSPNSFKDQQTDVSQQLLDKIIIGLQQWHSHTN